MNLQFVLSYFFLQITLIRWIPCVSGKNWVLFFYDDNNPFVLCTGIFRKEIVSMTIVDVKREKELAAYVSNHESCKSFDNSSTCTATNITVDGQKNITLRTPVVSENEGISLPFKCTVTNISVDGKQVTTDAFVDVIIQRKLITEPNGDHLPLHSTSDCVSKVVFESITSSLGLIILVLLVILMVRIFKGPCWRTTLKSGSTEIEGADEIEPTSKLYKDSSSSNVSQSSPSTTFMTIDDKGFGSGSSSKANESAVYCQPWASMKV